MTIAPPESALRTFGSLNGPAVGILLKELVRRATGEIRKQRLNFVSTGKTTFGKADIVTSADYAAQLIFIKMILELFPGFGIIAEERLSPEQLDTLGLDPSVQDQDSRFLKIECTFPGRSIYITIDPLDGTKAFGRRKPSGVATQIALLEIIAGKPVVLSAWVGDVNTMEIYGYRPGSSNVHRITDLEASEHLNDIERTDSLLGQRVILRDLPENHSELIQQMLKSPFSGGLANGVEVMSGSATLTAAQLWTGNGGLLVLGSHAETPWDAAPLMGIMETLGFRCFHVGSGFLPADWPVPLTTYYREPEIIWVHRSNAAELVAWAERTIRRS